MNNLCSLKFNGMKISEYLLKPSQICITLFSFIPIFICEYAAWSMVAILTCHDLLKFKHFATSLAKLIFEIIIFQLLSFVWPKRSRWHNFQKPLETKQFCFQYQVIALLDKKYCNINKYHVKLADKIALYEHNIA